MKKVDSQKLLEDLDALIAKASGIELEDVVSKDRTSDLENRAKVSAKLDDFERAYLDLSAVVADLTPEFVDKLDSVRLALDSFSDSLLNNSNGDKETQLDVANEEPESQEDSDNDEIEPIDFDKEAELVFSQQDESLDHVDKIYKNMINLLREVEKMTFDITAPTDLDSNKLHEIENLLASIKYNIINK